MKEIIIVGAGGHAKILVDIIHRSKVYNIVGVIGAEDETDNEFMGYPIYKGDEYLEVMFNRGIRNIGIGIGGYTDNLNRHRMYDKVKTIGYSLPDLVDKSSIISENVIMGEGVIVFAGVVINTGVNIGNNVVIATSSTIDHDTEIEDHVLISAGVTIGAGDRIQRGSLIALGAKVVSRVNICPDVLIGAGAVVVGDIKEPGTYLGVPARRIK